jgi:hypothetical protein
MAASGGKAGGEQAVVSAADARALWMLLEPCHAVVYFAPEGKDAYREVGLKGGWMGYFGSRGAAFGPVPAEVVIATFYNFAPPLVRRAIPDAWRLADTGDILAARLQVADAALNRLLGDMATAPEVEEAAELARAAAEVAVAADLTGRPVFAAHAALPWPTPPHLVLWHAATLLREHRGDGHVTQLFSAGIDGCEANVLQAKVSQATAAERGGVAIDDDTLRPARGWSETEWAQATARLAHRGWLDETGTITPVGLEQKRFLEDRTDALAVLPWVQLGPAVCQRLQELLRPVVDRIWDRGGIADPNPVGLPRPR